MEKKTILLVFGTRPEAIKMAPVIKALIKRDDIFNVKVAVTGQHREMLDQVLRLFDIVPDYDLNIMKTGQDLFDVTTRILMGMRDLLPQAAPDIVLVHGDTSTSAAAALSAFYMRIPVAHIEAGLRTWNMYSPWPEEMNRQITGRIASVHFAPTELSRENLLKENIDCDMIHVTGNTVIDALNMVVDHIKSDVEIREKLATELYERGYNVSRIDGSRRMVLITGHRRENFGKGFENICDAILNLSNAFPNTDFVYPMHLNPNVREPISKTFSKIPHENVFFIEPLDYLPFIYMMELSSVILTDSGGIQEEAPSLGKPVLVMREVTERPEALMAGTIKLVGTDREKIISEVSHLLNDSDYYNDCARHANPYGDGHAAERITQVLSNILN